MGNRRTRPDAADPEKVDELERELGLKPERPPVEMPQPGDLVFAPSYSPSPVVVDSVTSRGEVLVTSPNGTLAKLPPVAVESWFRPYWRRRRDADPPYLLDGEVER